MGRKVSGAAVMKGHTALTRGILRDKEVQVISKGDQFMNAHDFPVWVFAQQLLKWLGSQHEHPEKLSRYNVEDIWWDARRSMKGDNKIIIASTPEEVDVEYIQMLDGGILHEVFHSLYTVSGRKLDLGRVQSILDEHYRPEVMYELKTSLFVSILNCYEDSMIERHGFKDFEGAKYTVQRVHERVWELEAERRRMELGSKKWSDKYQRYIPSMDLAGHTSCYLRDQVENYLEGAPLDEYHESARYVVDKCMADLVEAGRQTTDSYQTFELTLRTMNRLSDLTPPPVEAEGEAEQQEQDNSLAMPRKEHLEQEPQEGGEQQEQEGGEEGDEEEQSSDSDCGAQQQQEQQQEEGDDPQEEDEQEQSSDSDCGQSDDGEEGDSEEGDSEDGESSSDGLGMEDGPEDSSGDEAEEGGEDTEGDEETSENGSEDGGEDSDTAEEEGEDGESEAGGDEAEGEEEGEDSSGDSEDGDEEESEAATDEGDDAGEEDGGEDEGTGDNDDSEEEEGSGSEDAGAGDDGGSGGVDEEYVPPETDFEAIRDAQEADGMEDTEDVINNLWEQQQDSSENVPDWPYAYDPTQDIVKEVEGGDLNEYQKIAQQVRKDTLYIRPKMLNYLRGQRKVKRQHGLSRGRTLSSRTVGQVIYKRRPKPFQKRVKTDRQDTAISIVMDESGSMIGSLSEARYILITFAVICQQLNIPFEVVGFTSYIWFEYVLGRKFENGTNSEHDKEINKRAKEVREAGGFTRISALQNRVFRTFDEPVTDRDLSVLTQTEATGGTPIASGLAFSGKRLAERPETRKLAIVITDGTPTGMEGSRYASPNKRLSVQKANTYQLCNNVAAKLQREAGIETLFVGYSDDADVKNLNNSIHIEDLSEFSKKMAAYLLDQMKGGR